MDSALRTLPVGSVLTGESALRIGHKVAASRHGVHTGWIREARKVAGRIGKALELKFVRDFRMLAN